MVIQIIWKHFANNILKQAGTYFLTVKLLHVSSLNTNHSIYF